MTRYHPEPVPYTDDIAYIREYLGREFSNIFAAFEAVELLELQRLSMPPERDRDGMIKYADGVNWNPGAGEGFYGYKNGAWHKFDIVSTDTITINKLIANQIQFPATEVPSADPNTLDDYEEGTWTPGITFSGGSSGITYNSREGFYIKIGALVYIRARLQLSSKGVSAGTATITGLPFAVTQMLTGVPFVYWSNFTGLTGALTTTHSTTVLSIRQADSASTLQLTDTSFTNTSDMIISGCYGVE